MPADRPILAASGFTPDWLTGQRWFRAKQRRIGRVGIVDSAMLPPDGPTLLVLAVEYADGGSDRYLVPAVADEATLREPRDGEGAWARLVAAMAAGLELRASAGRFAFDATAVLDELVPSARDAAAALPERRLRVEQSNTSVVLDERLILKLYRLLEPGLSPDLEVSAFLTEVGFADTPPLAGSARYLPDGGEPAAAAMLQAFVPTRGDAWSVMLELLAVDPPAAAEVAREIGGVTARLHAALAARPTDPAFPARPAGVAETGEWRASAEGQLAQAVAAVDGEARRRLEALAPAIRARFADAFGSATAATRVTRIHGDYHLGQILAVRDGGYGVIDFEGEPARTLAERQRPGSPLRDVAGLLRSLDYAARTVEHGTHVAGYDAAAWLATARAAALDAYGRLDPGDRALLDAFELEKACYEVRYEANNRPDWLWLPLDALDRLAGAR